MWEFEKFQEQIALIDENTFLTYKELMEYTDKMKQILEERSFCFLLCDAGIGPMIHYISMIENRVVPLLLDVKIDKKLLQELINEYQPDYLCVPENLDEYQEEKAIEHSYGYKTIEWSKAKRQPLYEDLALLLSTSGSTGSNKLVRLSYKNIYSNAKSISEYLQLDETERPITTLPMNYTYGLSIINSHLLVGATILVSSRTFIQKGFWEFFEKHGATSFGGVPATYDILYKIGFLNYDLKSLRYLTQAGGKLSISLQKILAEYANQKNIKFYIMYGQTEATARIAYLPPELADKKYESIGVMIPGGKGYLVDSENHPIDSVGEEGELVFESPSVMLGYAQCRRDLSRGDDMHGVLHTGDIMRQDEDRCFYVVGRKKRFIKLYGMRISLDEVERILKDKFVGEAFACTGNDECIHVYFEEERIADEVLEFLMRVLKIDRKVIYFHNIEKLPRNPSGKVIYSELL